MKSVRLILLGLTVLAAAAGLRAQVVLALHDDSTFTGSEEVLGFNSLANLELISTQFASEGVTFSPGLMGSTNSGDTSLFPNNADGVIATNWLQTPPRADTWTMTFAIPQEQVGFLVEMNNGDFLQLTTSLGATTHGSVTYLSGGTASVFFGVSDSGTFDTLTFTVGGPVNHFFAMDNFKFEAVPEPSVVLLLSLGLPLAAWGRSRRKVRL